MNEPATITPLFNIGDFSRRVAGLCETYHQIHGLWPDTVVVPPRAYFCLIMAYGPVFRVGIVPDLSKSVATSGWNGAMLDMPSLEQTRVTECTLRVCKGDELAVLRRLGLKGEGS